MASVRKRKWRTPAGKPRSGWVVDYRDELGRRKSKQFSTQAEAREWAEATDLRTAQKENGAWTIADAANLWVQRAEADGLERSTVVSYRRCVERHILPQIGEVRLADLTRHKLLTIREEFRSRTTDNGTRTIMHNLKMILKYAQGADLTDTNAAAGLRTTRSSRHKPRPTIPERQELRAILEACDRPSGRNSSRPKMRQRSRTLFMMLIETAMRPSEARGLAWRNVNLDEAWIEVVQRADQWGDVGPCKTRAAYRKIPISSILVSALKEWKRVCPESELDLVFPTRGGGPISGRNLIREFQLLQVAAEVTRSAKRKNGTIQLVAKYRVYDLRHAGASWWIHKRVDLKKLTTWMGHSSIQVTFDIYGHLIEDVTTDHEVMDALKSEIYGKAAGVQQEPRKPAKNRDSAEDS